jgi:UDP-N-acetylglucosamine 4,6-dehydratase
LIDCLADRVVLVTGGAGSLGKQFIKHILLHNNPQKVIVYSRDEYKHSSMQEEFKDKRIRYFIGDVRDLERLRWAFKEVDIVVHAAAMKQVTACEYNPEEAVKTNIEGAKNIIDATRDACLERVIFISSDKAVSPLNLYGSTKAAAEKLFLSANAMNPIFSCTRWGNIEGSKGSIIPLFNSLINQGCRNLPLTDERMTRFSVTYTDAISTILSAIELPPGLIICRKAPSIRITDLIEAVGCGYDVVGIRPGEKLHEMLVSEHEYGLARDCGDYIAIIPRILFNPELDYSSVNKEPLTGPYTSDNNIFLTVDEIRERIKHV